MLGPKTNCHVRTTGEGQPVVLSCQEDGITRRAKENIVVAGTSKGREAEVPLGEPVEIGNLTFTLTALRGKGN